MDQYWLASSWLAPGHPRSARRPSEYLATGRVYVTCEGEERLLPQVLEFLGEDRVDHLRRPREGLPGRARARHGPVPGGGPGARAVRAGAAYARPGGQVRRRWLRGPCAGHVLALGRRPGGAEPWRHLGADPRRRDPRLHGREPRLPARPGPGRRAPHRGDGRLHERRVPPGAERRAARGLDRKSVV